MTTDDSTRPTAPATGLFGSGKPASQAAESHRGEPTSTQRKSFSDLFRSDAAELHTA